MSTCPKCGGTGTKAHWNTATEADRNGMRAGAAWSRGHPSKTPHEAAVKLAITGGVVAAKLALSTVYRCSGCKHTWRKWL